jgi:large subunit ribosomal protein L54
LTGLNYLKGQPPVVAKQDGEYPSWLWELLKPKVYTDMSPGSKGEKAALRKANKQRIKEQNFLKTQ